MPKRMIILAVLVATFSGSAATGAVGQTADADPTSAAPAPAEAGPRAIVGELQAGLLDLMKRADEIGFEGRYNELGELLASTVDVDFMAQKAVGSHWRKLDEQEQARWLEAFRRMTRATYADRFEGYSGQHFETVGQEVAAHQTTLVRTTLVIPDDDDVELNYRLRETQAGWRIIDVYLNGTVSELALRRSEYAAVLKRDGFEKLITTVEGKTQSYAAAAAVN